MARDFNGSSDYGTQDGVLSVHANDTVGTIFFWIYFDVDTGDHSYPFIITKNGSFTTGLHLNFRWLATNDRLDFRIVIDGTLQWNITTDTEFLDAYIGSWVSFALVQDGVEPDIWWNGSELSLNRSTTTDTTKWLKSILTDATAVADEVNIGRLSSGTAYHNGKMAEEAIWDRALTSSELVGLSKGFSPSHYPNGLKTYVPMKGRTSPEIEVRNNSDITLTGTSYFDHPPMIYPYHRTIFVPAAGAAQSIVPHVTAAYQTVNG